jgi:arginine N-succinyltransferase
LFLIRRAKIEDTGTLLKLARMVHFINLPADKDIISDKVMRSRESFLRAAAGGAIGDGAEEAAAERRVPRKGPARGLPGGLASLTQHSDIFMFVLEDTSIPAVADTAGADRRKGNGAVLGTSQIISRMGGPGQPNVSFELSRKEMFSSSLQVGATHIVAKLILDETGPTEIGGLILQPSYRGHKMRLGRFLSLVRFHVMGLYRPMFADRVLAEMMAPITPDGRNTLWEYLGRRFINLTYTEADRFCQYSKEFMTSLLPREEIYLTLLPPEARAVIAQVGPETVPARRMLERLGFAYRDRIDPFDGGPHLEAETDSIPIVRDTVRATLGEAVAGAACDRHGIVSVLDGDGDFRAIEAEFGLDGSGTLRTTKAQMKLLGVKEGAAVGCTPLGGEGSGAKERGSASRASRKAGARENGAAVGRKGEGSAHQGRPSKSRSGGRRS